MGEWVGIVERWRRWVPSALKVRRFDVAAGGRRWQGVQTFGNVNAEVGAAAVMVNAHEFINQMEQGYDSQVGEGGNRLSTGQRQLLSFARALLANPQLFVMDEATSSIDTETEQLIQRGLETMFTGRISFVIAHRLSTIRGADRILVITKGRIEECGTHEELLRSRGHYYDLYTSQFRREREEAALEAQA